jgi:trimeric autotransporter adhesin
MEQFRSTMLRLSVFLIVLLLSVAGLQAQTNYGAVRGEVKDAEGGTLRDAHITLTNQDTKVVRNAVTNETGIYLFGAVDPGTYKVTIETSGFKRSDTEGIIVTLGATSTVDATLAVGAAVETVEVTADTLSLNTANASGGQLFNAQQIQDLPLLGRNPFMLEAFDANVVTLGDPRYVRAEDQTGSSQVSLAGAPSNSNSYVVDGIPISTSSGGVTFIPTIESVADAKVQANTYDAEVGRSGGGVFNSTLRSGTSQYHGVLYGETRQTAWSANLWFNHFAGAATPNNETYIYEGGFGGPLPFSKKIHWLDNTFFWVDEAGYRQGQPLTGVTTSYYVPTAAERAGDFSADVNYPLYDPTKRSSTGANTCRLSRLGDCGAGGASDTLNVVPAAYINAIGLYTAGAFPAPTSAGLYGAGNNFSNPNVSFKSRDDTYSGKIEHIFAPWYSASASYVHSAIQEPSGNPLIVPYASSTKLLRYTDATAINNTFTINPTLLLTVGYGFNRYYSASWQYSTGFNPATGFGGAGFPPSFANQLQSATFPAITLTGVSSTASIGASNSGPTVYASHNVNGIVTKILNRHSVKVGYAWRGFNVYTNPTTGGAGAFTFNGEYSNATGASNTNSPGAIADMIMGVPSAATVTLNSGVFINTISYNAVFAQDDFRLNDKLTLNLGLRYEYEPGQSEQSNRYNVGFDPNATASYTGASGNTVNVKGGIAFAGVNGAPTHCCNNSNTKFSPRIGIAFSPRKDMVIHAGYGIFYAPVGIAAATNGYSQTSTLAQVNATGPTTVGSSAYLSNPFPGGLLQPTGNSLGALTSIGSSLTGSSTYAFTTGLQDFNKRFPFVEQYSVDLEQQLPADVLIKIGYYGAHARNFANYTNINQIPDAVLATYAPGGVNAGINLANGPGGVKPANPYYAKTIGGLPATGVVSTSTAALGQLLLPYPQFGSIFELESSGYSNYNSLVVKAEKRTRQGLTVLATYTWAANWDNIWSTGSQIYSSYGPQDANNPKAEYARSLNSIPNRATAIVTYDLPFGRGKQFLGTANRWVDELVGGWSVNDEWIDQNGVPLSIQQSNLSTTFGTTGVGGTYQRPNLVGDVHLACGVGRPQGRLGNFFSGQYETPYLTASAFTAAAPYTYGNAPRMLPCRAPGYNNQNISVFKDISITERVKLQFRAEALNAFNTPEFAPPTLTYVVPSPSSVTTPPVGASGNSQALGNITTTIGFARIIQLGGRLSF